jgi:hypothetical protein
MRVLLRKAQWLVWLLGVTSLLGLIASPQNTAAISKLAEWPSSCEGLCDLRLSIQKVKSEPDGTLILRVAALYKHAPIGLQITLAPGMVPGYLNAQTGMPDPRSVTRGGIRFERTGPEDDQFVAAIAKLYASKLPPKTMGDDIHFDAYAVEGDPAKIQTQAVLFRIFHLASGASATMQCELLLYVNLPKNEVIIRESNQDYRESLVQILGRAEE